MFIKVVFYEKLLFFLLKAREAEAEYFLNTKLSVIGNKVKKNTFSLSKENGLEHLNIIFNEFKANYKYYLKFSPPPFSIFIVKDPNEKIDAPFFRAGKIYFTKTIKKEVEKHLKKISFFNKIENWFDCYELVFPATLDQKLLIPFKDVFWTGNHNFCFFCDSTLHDFTNCPALKLNEPTKILIENINLSFTEIAENLADEMKKAFTKEKTFFFSRYYYFLPIFLKIVFFKTNEIRYWKNLNIEQSFPIRGGGLGLGLEFLLKGDFSKAESYFKSMEENPIVSLGLFFVFLFKKEFSHCFYYLENIMESTNNLFIKSYAYLLRGRLNEFLNEIYTAEDSYKEALRIDPSCMPARYHLTLLNYKEERDFSILNKLFEHSDFIYYLFLDPYLVKDQKECEDTIFRILEDKREIAVQRLKEAENKLFEVKEFLPEKKYQEYKEKIHRLHQMIYKGGIKSIEKACEIAPEIALELQKYFYNTIKEVQKDLENLKKEYESLRHFWNAYPYKGLDPFFGRKLKELGEMIININNKMSSSRLNKIIKIVMKELENSENKLKELLELKKELEKKWIFRLRLYYFLRNFSILEGIFLCLYVILYIYEINILTPFSFIVISIVLMILCILNASLKEIRVG